MTTTRHKNKLVEYSPSVNLERDISRGLNYIPTPNAIEVYEKIVSDYKLGVRSFSLVGAYGTGKSAFLLALQQTLGDKAKYFKRTKIQFGGADAFEFINLTGQYQSLVEIFAELFDIPKRRDFSSAEIIKAITLQVRKSNKQGKVYVISIDEFGKFLEFASKHNPEKELYFIQLLAELANDDDKDLLFLTTLHQDFNGYSRTLTKSQQNEWYKVKGRIKDIPFNEPVEQLLYLGAERMVQLKLNHSKSNLQPLYKAIFKAKIFPLSDYNSIDFSQKLLPFDILSAAVMTRALQQYGQNERSLFVFLESHDPLGIREFNTTKAPYYNLACVYDYLAFNFHTFLNSDENPHKQHWYAMRNAIERCEGLLESKAIEAIKLVKTIGLLNFFGSTAGRLHSEFLEVYGGLSLAIRNTKDIIKLLLKHKIIRFVKFNQKFVLFEGTDVDIDWVINEAGNMVGKVSNIVDHVQQYFDASLIPAKSVFYEVGTPRFFQFLLSDTIESSKIPEGEIDGYINLVFSEKIREAELRTSSAACQEAILFGLIKNTPEISNEIHTIEKIKKAAELHKDDPVTVKVLDGIKQQHIKLLNHYLSGSIYSNNGNIIWYFRGERLCDIRDRKSFNQKLSFICEQIYNRTPVYKNEMLNKSSYHSVIGKARRDLTGRLIESYYVKDIGYRQDEFPPDKSIYLSLIQNTGIHKEVEGSYVLQQPTTGSLRSLIEVSNKFLESSKHGKRNLKELVDILQRRPYKLKQGLIDFWIPVYLLIKKDDYALFYDEVFVPQITEGTLDLVVRSPHKYEVKAFEVEGPRLDLFNKYRQLINKEKSEKPKSQTFIDTIRPFISFYNKDLTFYAKQTNTISLAAQRLREAIATSKDPETTFFDKFPEAFGYTLNKLKRNETEMQAYVSEIQAALRELRTVYSDLLERFEKLIVAETAGTDLSFEEYKKNLQARFEAIKTYLLNQSQNIIYKQIFSPIDDRSAWLNAIAHACVDKRPDQFTDTDEKILHEKFVHYIHQLDNLCELSKTKVDYDNEDIVKLEITSFVQDINERIIRMPRSKTADATRLANNLQARLGRDTQMNIIALIKLLQEQLNNE